MSRNKAFEEVAALHDSMFRRVVPVNDPPLNPRLAQEMSGEVPSVDGDLHRALQLSKLATPPNAPSNIFDGQNAGSKVALVNDGVVAVLAQIEGKNGDSNDVYNVTLRAPEGANYNKDGAGPYSTKIWAIIEYGSGGLQEAVTIEWLSNGQVIRVPGNFIRVKAFMWRPNATHAFDGKIGATLSAFISKGVTERVTRPILALPTGTLAHGANFTFDFGEGNGQFFINDTPKSVICPLSHLVDVQVQYSPATLSSFLIDLLDGAGHVIGERDASKFVEPLMISSQAESVKVTNGDGAISTGFSNEVIFGIEL